MQRRLIFMLLVGLAAIALVFGARRFLGGSNTHAPLSVAGTPAPEVGGTKILVAKRDIHYGERASGEDFAWADWPEKAPAGNFVVQKAAPNAIGDFAGRVAKIDFLAGDPIVEARLVNPGAGGNLPALLASGMRAVAIAIDAPRSAGGLISPNDRVDVMSVRDVDIVKPGSSEKRTESAAEILVENVKILAIDKNIVPDPKQPGLSGDTATLEVTPAQAVLLEKAQRIGSLTLLPRSVFDARATGNGAPHTRVGDVSRQFGARDSASVVIFRGDVPSVESAAR